MKTGQTITVILLSALAYPLSAGPIDLIYRLSGRTPMLYSFIRIFYSPLAWILEQSEFLREPFAAYMRLWGGP